MERAVGSSGPGVSDMCLSAGRERLFSLLGEADSILMSDAHTCRPLAVNRCGCNPQNLSRCGEIIAVSGGESSCVYLFSAQTLDCIARIPTPGPACSALLDTQAMYALCLTAELNSILFVRQSEGERLYALEGMPGCLSRLGENIHIFTAGKQYLFLPASERLMGMRSAPGRAHRICCGWGKIYLQDPLSESIWVSENGRSWRRQYQGVKDMFFYRGPFSEDLFTNTEKCGIIS